MRGEEFLGFWPERGHGLRGVIEIDDEAVGFVMVCHVAKDIVVDVAEEVDFGFYAPVVSYVLKGWVLVEEARIPTAHLVVGYQVAVLDLLFLQDLCGFGEEVGIYPRWHSPLFFGDEFVVAFCFGFGRCAAFEFFGEGHIVEEGPGVVEFGVPSAFEVAHGLDHAVDFFVPD